MPEKSTNQAVISRTSLACSLSFERRPLLVDGSFGFKKDGSAFILVNSEDSRNEQTITLWHEMVHLIMMAGGLSPSNHDEEAIEKTARKLADCCPEIHKWAFPENATD